MKTQHYVAIVEFRHAMNLLAERMEHFGEYLDNLIEHAAEETFEHLRPVRWRFNKSGKLLSVGLVATDRQEATMFIGPDGEWTSIGQKEEQEAREQPPAGFLNSEDVP
jgi:hypothetical protein